MLSNLFSNYSIASSERIIPVFVIFCIIIKTFDIAFLVRGLCPHPASGIRLGFSGNTTNADGIRLEQQTGSIVAVPAFSFIRGTASGALHKGQSAGSEPDPSSDTSVSISL